MSVLFRTLMVLACFWLAFVFFHHAQTVQAKPDADSSQLAVLFVGVILSGAVGAGILVAGLLPKIGDSVGNFFFNPNQKAPPHPHAKALAAMACGDYQKAFDEYRTAAEANPEDTLALSEAARISCEKLHDPEPAIALMEEALGRDWLPEDAAFLSLRLADLYWNHHHDVRRARELLVQVMDALPGTNHAANAAHRLQELERKLAMEE